MRKIGTHLRGHFVAYLALFFALGGTSFAAVNALPKNSVGSPQIKNGSIQKIDISKRTVSALRGLRGARGLTGATGSTGATGATGAQGIKGDTGAPGSALAYAHVLADGTLDTANSKNIVGEEHSPGGNTGRYCFDLGFTPMNAIATSQKISFEANSVVLQVGLEPGAITGICPAPFQDASVYAWASNTAALTDSAFFIVFE
jgi:hypothetical protein